MRDTKEVVIRPARSGDLLVLLEQEQYTANPNWARARTEPATGEGEGVCLVAEVNDEPVGMAHVYRLPEALTHGARWARVSVLLVDDRHRSHGIGSTLLSACEQQARQMGAAFLEVTASHRRTSTRHFCLNRGYTETNHSFAKKLSQE